MILIIKKKNLDNKLLDLLNDLKKEQIELLTNKNIEGVKYFSKLTDFIVDLVLNYLKNLIVEIFDTGYISTQPELQICDVQIYFDLLGVNH